MMNRYHRQAASAIRATTFHSATSYSWFGKQTPQLPLTTRRELSPPAARETLLGALQLQLYRDFYCPGAALPSAINAASSLLAGRTLFVQELSVSNAGDGYWQDGWEVRAIRDGEEVTVYKEGMQLRAGSADYAGPQGSALAPGMRVKVRFPKELLGISPGFYMAMGNEELAQDKLQGRVRLYWHLTAQGSVHFMRRMTSILNRARLPFQLKALNEPSQFTRRCDSVVLYIRQGDYETVSEIMREIYPKLVHQLRPGIPAFTKPLAPGVGLAEDPLQGDSFGIHRCLLLADGMIRAYEQGKNQLDERLQVVEQRFLEEGVLLEQPYLNAGACDLYIVPAWPIQPAQPAHGRKGAAPSKTFLQAAVEIGERLLNEAVWYNGRCNWLGAEPPSPASKGAPAGTVIQSLGPTLYNGTSGVALFLGELYCATGQDAARHTALGAIRQALSRVEEALPSSRLGLYTGWAGIAFAAAYIGTLFGDDELKHQAMQLLFRALREDQGGGEVDLLAGRAGGLTALAALHKILDEPALMDFAMKLGDELLRSANRSKAGYSWSTNAIPCSHDLTGFSHGAAGIGFALLELYLLSGAARFLQGAEQAFRYERHWYDAREKNWPDFREEQPRGRRSNSTLSFATFWCHGAPGIALSRLRAFEILKDEIYKQEAMLALETTRAMVESSLRSGAGNYSLCHGLAGNAEVLFQGYQVLGAERKDDFILAQEVARVGIETYLQRRQPWPCGVGGAETPDLMLGLAGIGHTYLRFHDPTTPSLLIFRPQCFSDRLRSFSLIASP